MRALAMGLWVGALAGFAFIVAPVAFHSLGPVPAFAALIAAILRALTVFGWACAAAALVATALLAHRSGRFALFFIALVVAMAALSFYEFASVIPAMERTALQTPQYEALHKQSSSVYGVVLLFGITAVALLALVRDIGEG